MRTLTMVLMVAALMSTVGVYAASVTGASKALGGTGDVTVSAPTASTVTVSYTTDANGDVTAADVSWTPSAITTYEVKVKIGTTTGTLSVTTTDLLGRTDTVSISPAVPTENITISEVTINQTG